MDIYRSRSSRSGTWEKRVCALSLLYMTFWKLQLTIPCDHLVPALVLGILLGPVCAKITDVSQWGSEHEESTHEIAYGLSRLVIGIQLVKVGYELPKKYQKQRFVEMTICLLPVMTIMWLATTACIKLMVPKISFVCHVGTDI
jgi:NhaP-type Na+/H+ or K+/H+ antiporter